MSDGETRLSRAYEWLSGDDDADRICAAVPDSECRHAPRNYLLNVLNGAASKLAEQIAGPRLVLPWILSSAGAPAMVVGALMPIKQAGSLLPQLAVAGYLRARPRRKWFWCGAGLTQAACLMLMALLLGLSDGIVLSAGVLLLLLLFSLASGTASIAFQDVTAKTVGKGVRGGLLANRALVGGVLAMGAGAVLHVQGAPEHDLAMLGLLVAGAILWGLAALAFAAIREAPGATQGGRNPLAETRSGWRMTTTQPVYRQFLIARCSLMAVELGAPLYVLLAEQRGGVGLLGLLVASLALADILSSRIWGAMADRGAHRVLAAAGVCGLLSALGLAALAATEAVPSWSFALPFALLGVAEAGVRLGRKTWIVDASQEAARMTATAFSNTVSGVIALALSGLGLTAFASSLAPVFGVAALSLFGAVVAWRLPADAEIRDTAS